MALATSRKVGHSVLLGPVEASSSSFPIAPRAFDKVAKPSCRLVLKSSPLSPRLSVLVEEPLSNITLGHVCSVDIVGYHRAMIRGSVAVSLDVLLLGGVGMEVWIIAPLLTIGIIAT